MPAPSPILPSGAPAPQGLYDGQHEHDACGVALVADINGRRSPYSIVADALTALHNLDHRGASGAEINTGDGAGILVQVPDAFLREVVQFDLPQLGAYAVGMVFLPADDEAAAKAVDAIERIVAEEDLRLLGWRDVPTDPSSLGATALSVMPRFRHLFVAASRGEIGMALERRAFCARKRIEREVGVYLSSLSCRTTVYKGMLTTDQLPAFFPDVTDERFASAIALVHSRFSTNTFPSWPLAHPYRYVGAQRRDQHGEGQSQLDARP